MARVAGGISIISHIVSHMSAEYKYYRFHFELERAFGRSVIVICHRHHRAACHAVSKRHLSRRLTATVSHRYTALPASARPSHSSAAEACAADLVTHRDRKKSNWQRQLLVVAAPAETAAARWPLLVERHAHYLLPSHDD